MMDETGRILTRDDDIRRAIISARTLAVIGMKRPGEGPAHYVPDFMHDRGHHIIPVNPSYDMIDGKKCYASVEELEVPVDMIVVFRRSSFVPDHVDEILRMTHRPRTVWLQLGIRHAEAARRLADAGIDVVEDRCLMIEFPRLVHR